MRYAGLVTFHKNPYTCGVARFNHSLARVMDLPLVTLNEYLVQRTESSFLLSIKFDEIDAATLDRVRTSLNAGLGAFDLLLHGTDGSILETQLCRAAIKVFTTSKELAEKIKPIRSDAVALFAPGAPVMPRQSPVDCTLLTFGMAHKIRSSGYQKLGNLIAGDHRSFRLEISTALHDGGTFDEDFFMVGEEISKSFTGNVRFLGFLADLEVSERLRTVDALVAFFPGGARENNTTVLSAMTHGCPVVTNLDSASPSWMVHNETLFDVDKLMSFPTSTELRVVGENAAVAAREFSFAHLADLISFERNLH